MFESIFKNRNVTSKISRKSEMALKSFQIARRSFKFTFFSCNNRSFFAPSSDILCHFWFLRKVEGYCANCLGNLRADFKFLRKSMNYRVTHTFWNTFLLEYQSSNHEAKKRGFFRSDSISKTFNSIHIRFLIVPCYNLLHRKILMYINL